MPHLLLLAGGKVDLMLWSQTFILKLRQLDTSAFINKGCLEDASTALCTANVWTDLNKYTFFHYYIELLLGQTEFNWFHGRFGRKVLV